MVLVDTSVWIRFLGNRPPYAIEMDRLLSLDIVVGHELIYGELLIGDKGGRKKLLTGYEQMRQSPRIPHREVVAFVRARGLNGRGAGWTDVHLLASVVAEHLKFWTADARLAILAHELGVAHEFSA